MKHSFQMSKKPLSVVPSLIVILAAFVACNNSSELPSQSTSTPVQANSIVYQNGDFNIKESPTGDEASTPWTKIAMPKNRIANPLSSLDVEYEKYSQPNSAGFLFHQTISVPSNDNSTNLFELESEYFGGNGKAALKKNGQVIWEGYMNGGNDLPISSFWNFNGEIIFWFTDYSDPGVEQITDYVIYSDGNKAIVIPSAFAPSVMNGEVIYFQRVEGKISLVRDGLMVGELYDNVLRACCGQEATHGILHDGRVIDFFATRNNAWYHVQAGFQP